MRILIDYRPALRQRSGVGEYVHQLTRALLRALGLAGGASQMPAGAAPSPALHRLTVFSSSWKDRLSAESRLELDGADLMDRRVPVHLLNLCWHRLGWPPVERLTGRTFDVVHAPHPLLLPSRHAARVVTVHDLDFLAHTERVRAEVRRDYPRLVATHAQQADAVIVPSQATAAQVIQRLGVPPSRVHVCPEGVPEWPAAGPVDPPPDGYVLFVGTLEPRKNVPGLLAAYRQVLERQPDAPMLVLAGQTTPAASPWLEELQHAPLAGRVIYRGYVEPSGRYALYRGARLLVLPSFDEGFGLPALEAMSLGIPVVVSNRGALPEVVGEAGLLVNPDDVADIANAMAALLTDPARAARLSALGRRRAQQFSWDCCAALTRQAYEAACERRARERGRH